MKWVVFGMKVVATLKQVFILSSVSFCEADEKLPWWSGEKNNPLCSSISAWVYFLDNESRTMEFAMDTGLYVMPWGLLVTLKRSDDKRLSMHKAKHDPNIIILAECVMVGNLGILIGV